jgi:hypothetical protein
MRHLSADGATQGPGATRVVRLTPWAALGVSAAIAATAVALGLSRSGGTDLVIFLTIAVLGLVFGATGAPVASRMPNNPIGWIFCALALLFQSSGLADAYVAYGGGTGASLPGRIWVAWVSQWFLNVASPALIILCFLLFPTGRLPSARWRPLLWVVACVAALYAASAALAPGGWPIIRSRTL